jgi:hypothetical protein
MVGNSEIAKITIETLEVAFYDYFKKPKKETSHIILDRLFPDERRITSAMSGIQTSLGTSVWEKLAVKLAKLNGFTMISPNDLTQPKGLREDNVIFDLNKFRKSLDKNFPDPPAGNDLTQKAMTKGKGADIILTRGKKTYIFDIKTVQVNAGNGNTYNESIIMWIAYWHYKNPGSSYDIDARIVFPYNSSDEKDDDGWWPEFGGRIKPLTRDDIMVGNQFWSFISGNPNALKHIVHGIDQICNDSVFIDLYSKVFECDTADKLKDFTKLVKVKQAEKLACCSLAPGQEINMRKKLLWQTKIDGEIYKFNERINKLIEDGSPHLK